MRKKRVLVAPMDWGLGHATRCIPVINELMELGCEVLVAGAGPSLHLLKVEFPRLTFLELPAYRPVYPASANMVLSMLLQAPHFAYVINRERKVTKRIVDDYQIDMVISDNRFGCRSARVPSVIITHQLRILMPHPWRWLHGFINSVNQRLLSRFTECWVPDEPGSAYTGQLSAGTSMNARYIGVLSRFRKTADENGYRIAAILSGPEPQRSILEQTLLKQLRLSSLKSILVRGMVGSEGAEMIDGVDVIDFQNTTDLQRTMAQSQIIIARSGYSTVMDLAALGKKAIFIPTPGQTEQEYLAQRLNEEGIAPFLHQDEFSLDKALARVDRYSGFSGYDQHDFLLRDALRGFIQHRTIDIGMVTD